MKFKKLMTFALAAFMLAGCAPKQQQNTTKLKIVATTFPQYDWIREIIGKDNKNVYLLGKKLKNVSPKEFEILNEDYIKDDKNIYKVKLEQVLFFSSNEINTKKISVDGLDVKTFRTLENDKEIETNYFGDKNSVYYIYENIDKIKEAVRNSFKILDFYIATDKKYVYYIG